MPFVYTPINRNWTVAFRCGLNWSTQHTDSICQNLTDLGITPTFYDSLAEVEAV